MLEDVIYDQVPHELYLNHFGYLCLLCCINQSVLTVSVRHASLPSMHLMPLTLQYL